MASSLRFGSVRLGLALRWHLGFGFVEGAGGADEVGLEKGLGGW